jgi:hypothetical protein
VTCSVLTINYAALIRSIDISGTFVCQFSRVICPSRDADQARMECSGLRCTLFHKFKHSNLLQDLYRLLLTLVIQDDRKVTQPIPDPCSICQKIHYIEIKKQKNNVILSVGNVHRVQCSTMNTRCTCKKKKGILALRLFEDN